MKQRVLERRQGEASRLAASALIAPSQYDLTHSVTVLPFVGEATAKSLSRLGISTIRDLLWHWPRAWKDLSHPAPIRSARINEPIVLEGTLADIHYSPRFGRRKARVTAQLVDAEGDSIPVIWFNQGYLRHALVEDQSFVFSGTPRWDWQKRRLYLPSPQRETERGVVPIYPETRGITSRLVRRLISHVLTSLDLPDPVQHSSWISLTEAVRTIHQPRSLREVARAQERLALDEFLLLAEFFSREEKQRHSLRAITVSPPVSALQALVRRLPFSLTNEQRRAAWNVIQRLQSAVPTQQLLQGDVGSGKTLVATLVSLSVLEAGSSVLWLAPTVGLSGQLARRIEQYLGSGKYRVEQATAQTKPSRSSKPRLIVGTHALLEYRTHDKQVGLVIVDEQHKFGVKQREQLLSPSRTGYQPHVLAMSATPIPRSLALAYADILPIESLRSKPHGSIVRTTIIPSSQRRSIFSAIQADIRAGRQVFVVVPRIESEDRGDGLQTRSLAEIAAEYQAQLPGVRFGIVHGKKSAKEQAEVLAQFEQGQTQVLVATTIVEVGIDIPNATVMVIESPELLGLAQLHQLRGRIGRGASPGQCFLTLSSNADPLLLARLERFAQTNDGFALAELDLQLRGPGDLMGELQAGAPQLRFADLSNTILLSTARKIVQSWQSKTPSMLDAWRTLHHRSL